MTERLQEASSRARAWWLYRLLLLLTAGLALGAMAYVVLARPLIARLPVLSAEQQEVLDCAAGRMACDLVVSGQDGPVEVPDREAFERHVRVLWTELADNDPTPKLNEWHWEMPSWGLGRERQARWLADQPVTRRRVLPSTRSLSEDKQAQVESRVKRDLGRYDMAVANVWHNRAAPIRRAYDDDLVRWHGAMAWYESTLWMWLGLPVLFMLAGVLVLARPSLTFSLRVAREKLIFGWWRIPWDNVAEVRRKGSRLELIRYLGGPLQSPPLRDPEAFEAVLKSIERRTVKSRPTLGAGGTRTVFSVDGASLLQGRSQPGRWAIGALLVPLLGLGLAFTAYTSVSVPPPIPPGLDCIERVHPACHDLPSPMNGAPSPDRLRARRLSQWRRAYAEFGEDAGNHVSFPTGEDFRTQRSLEGHVVGQLPPGDRAWLEVLVMEWDWWRDPGEAEPVPLYEKQIAERVDAEVAHLTRISAEVSRDYLIRVATTGAAQREAAQVAQIVTRLLAGALALFGVLAGLLLWRARRKRSFSASLRGLEVDGNLQPWSKVLTVHYDAGRVRVETRDGREKRSRLVDDERAAIAFVKAARRHLLTEEEVEEERRAQARGREALHQVHAADRRRGG